MANANANLMSIANRSTATNSTSRTQNSLRTTRAPSDAKNSRQSLRNSSSRSQKNNFGSALDKANAQVTQPSQQSDEMQAVAESVESESVDSLPKASSHGKNNQKQDAPKQQNSQQNENAQPVAEDVVEKINSTSTLHTQALIADDKSQDILQNVEVEIVSSPQDVPKFSKEVTLNPVNNIQQEVTENSTPTISNNLRGENIDNVEDIEDKTPVLATSADMAFYFASNTESLLAVKDTPVAVETNNLMSIMPQARDNKAQAMLDFLSGKTWQSPTAENDSAQNLNLQNLSPQSNQTLQSQPVTIQPQFNPRPLNIPSTPLENQNSLQPQSDFQPTLNQNPLQPQSDFQPTLNQNPLQPQTDFQPTLNQNPLQSQIDFQPTLNQNPLQPQTDFQPTLNQNPLQTQADFQPTLNQNPLQSPTDLQPMMNQNPLQPQTDFQPMMNQNPLQPQTDFQPMMNQNPLQPQTDFQPMMNQNPLQPQTDFQPTLNQNPLQPQSDFQPTLNQNHLQPQTDFQPTLNQNPLQPQSDFQPTLQAQPQVQQQQFGAQINPQINSLQPQIDSKNVNQQAMSDLLGVNVQVENNLSESMPVMPTQDFSQQFEQNQPQNNFQQNFTPVTSEIASEINTQPEGAENFAGNVVAAINHPQNNQPTAQVQTPDIPQVPREDFNVPAQIVEQARMIRSATNTEMVINLKPEHLGELTLKVSVGTSGAITASFYSDNAQVRAIIENSLVQLKQELNDQGIKVDDVEVYAGLSEDGLLNGQGQQAWQQNQQQRNHRGTIDLGAVEEELDSLTPVNENLSTDGVDYKV